MVRSEKVSAKGEGETLWDAKRTDVPRITASHSRALTPDAVAPGQQRQAQHGVAQLEDDTQGAQDVHQLRGRGIDPHGTGQKPEEGKDLPGRGVTWSLGASCRTLHPSSRLSPSWGHCRLGRSSWLLLCPSTLSPVQSELGWSLMGVEGWGHLTQWYLGGCSLLVVMKMMVPRTEPTSVTSAQTGKTPWIWYSPSARGGEKGHQCDPAGTTRAGAGSDQARSMR